MAQRQTAIVVGAGLAGLVAARVLSDHFTNVKLVDRDYLPEDDTARSGVPQASFKATCTTRGPCPSTSAPI
jgi:flavin-dependent dehydrogenase